MNDNKNKLIGILQLLYENTDADHSMDTYQIINALDEMNLGRPDRKTIDANIKYLMEDVDFGIEKEKGKPNKYKWSIRTLDVNDLKMIVDALRSSNFVSKRDRLEITAKLKDLTSIHLAGLLDRDIVVSSFYESGKKNIQPSLDKIFQAINSKKKVSFNTITHDINCNEIITPEKFIVNPYLILRNTGNFYLIGTIGEDKKIEAFKIEGIRNLEITNHTSAPAPTGLSVDNYSRCRFNMLSGDFYEVTLECSNEAFEDIIDRFGTALKTERINDNTIRVKISVDVNEHFFGWIFSFMGKVKIVGPEKARIAYKKALETQSDY